MSEKTVFPHKTKLLQDLADGLREIEDKEHDSTPLACVDVQFFDDGELVGSGSPGWALDCLVNDIFFDESSDWSEATSIRVRVI